MTNNNNNSQCVVCLSNKADCKHIYAMNNSEISMAYIKAKEPKLMFKDLNCQCLKDVLVTNFENKCCADQCNKIAKFYCSSCNYKFCDDCEVFNGINHSKLLEQGYYIQAADNSKANSNSNGNNNNNNINKNSQSSNNNTEKEDNYSSSNINNMYLEKSASHVLYPRNFKLNSQKFRKLFKDSDIVNSKLKYLLEKEVIKGNEYLRKSSIISKSSTKIFDDILRKKKINNSSVYNLSVMSSNTNDVLDKQVEKEYGYILKENIKLCKYFNDLGVKIDKSSLSEILSNYFFILPSKKLLVFIVTDSDKHYQEENKEENNNKNSAITNTNTNSNNNKNNSTNNTDKNILSNKSLKDSSKIKLLSINLNFQKRQKDKNSNLNDNNNKLNNSSNEINKNNFSLKNSELTITNINNTSKTQNLSQEKIINSEGEVVNDESNIKVVVEKATNNENENKTDSLHITNDINSNINNKITSSYKQKQENINKVSFLVSLSTIDLKNKSQPIHLYLNNPNNYLLSNFRDCILTILNINNSDKYNFSELSSEQVFFIRENEGRIQQDNIFYINNSENNSDNFHYFKSNLTNDLNPFFYPIKKKLENVIPNKRSLLMNQKKDKNKEKGKDTKDGKDVKDNKNINKNNYSSQSPNVNELKKVIKIIEYKNILIIQLKDENNSFYELQYHKLITPKISNKDHQSNNNTSNHSTNHSNNHSNTGNSQDPKYKFESYFNLEKSIIIIEEFKLIDFYSIPSISYKAKLYSNINPNNSMENYYSPSNMALNTEEFFTNLFNPSHLSIILSYQDRFEIVAMPNYYIECSVDSLHFIEKYFKINDCNFRSPFLYNLNKDVHYKTISKTKDKNDFIFFTIDKYNLTKFYQKGSNHLLSEILNLKSVFVKEEISDAVLYKNNFIILLNNKGSIVIYEINRVNQVINLNLDMKISFIKTMQTNIYKEDIVSTINDKLRMVLSDCLKKVNVSDAESHFQNKITNPEIEEYLIVISNEFKLNIISLDFIDKLFLKNSDLEMNHSCLSYPCPATNVTIKGFSNSMKNFDEEVEEDADVSDEDCCDECECDFGCNYKLNNYDKKNNS